MHFPIEFYRIGSLFAHTGVASWWPLKSMQIWGWFGFSFQTSLKGERLARVSTKRQICAWSICFFLVTMLLGNTSYTLAKPFYVLLLFSRFFVFSSRHEAPKKKWSSSDDHLRLSLKASQSQQIHVLKFSVFESVLLQTSKKKNWAS